MNKSRSIVKLSPQESVKLEALGKFSPIPKALKSGLAFPKEFKAAAVVDKKGFPKYFVFDSPSFWDMLCAVDAKLEESLPAKEYVSSNPIGWLIDAIESRMPLNPKLVLRLKKGIEEAQKSGLVPFSKILAKLGLRN